MNRGYYSVFFEISILLLFIFIGYLIFDKFYITRKKKALGKFIRILLFEKVGKDKLFRGYFTGNEETDDTLGIYVIIKKQKKAISQVEPQDFFPDKEFGKCLMVCKYADDDFRPMSRLTKDDWYRKIDLKQEDYLETETITDDITGETKKQLKINDSGEYVPIIDDDGNEARSYKLESYNEPIGIEQTGREAQRFNRTFTKRMQEKRKERQGFWDKYGQWIMSAFMMIVVFLCVAYTINKTTEAQKEMASMFQEKADEMIEEVKSPLFAQTLLEKLEARNQPKEEPQK